MESEAPKRAEITGYLDSVNVGYAYGWAWNSAKPEERLEIVIYANDEPVAEGIANIYREDLERAGIGDGRYGFKIELPEKLRDGKEYIIKAKVKGQGNYLRNQYSIKLDQKVKFTLQNLKDLDINNIPRGVVEGFQEGKFIGWALLPEMPYKTLDIDVFIEGLFLGKTTTNIYRADISKVIGFPVKAGFEFSINQISINSLPEILDKLSNTKFSKSESLVFKIADTEYQLIIDLPFEKVIPEMIRILKERVLKPAYNRGRYLEYIEEFIREDPFIKEDLTDDRVKIIAFYLPQYHPFPENNDWWGPGFTEWTQITTAKPYFSDHYQPRIPADLGYYDLRNEDIQLKQIELAKKYGLYGFCYHYYWFSGKKLMDLPLERHFNNKYEFPFCICWANENWSRRWDGSDQDVLISQDDSEEDMMAFIREVSKYFTSPYYIKIKGAPFIIIYNLRKIPNSERTIELWKKYIRSLGFPDLHICMAETFGQDNSNMLCDSACEFPPHKVVSRLINQEIPDLPLDFKGNIYDYEQVVAYEISKDSPSYIRFRTIMGPWDNTPRRKKAGNIFHNFTPELFEVWLSFSVLDAKMKLPPEMRFVFINAWNEWAEGTYLEPDRKYGHRLLKAVKNSLSLENEILIETFLKALSLKTDEAERVFSYITTLKNSLDLLLKTATSFYQPKIDYYLSKFIPYYDNEKIGLKILEKYNNKIFTQIDAINGVPKNFNVYVLSKLGFLYLKGWNYIEGVPIQDNTPAYVVLLKENKIQYYAMIYIRERREDIAEAMRFHKDYFYGYSFIGELKRVEPGAYELAFLLPLNANTLVIAKSDIILYIA